MHNGGRIMTPYDNLDSSAYWKSAVGERSFYDLDNLARPKRKIGPNDVIGAAGSCFAQHVARRLRLAGFNFLDVEPPPSWLPKVLYAKYGYEMFSARYGNVYTSTQFKQLILRAMGRFSPAESFWISSGAYYDPFRPRIQAGGFKSSDEVFLSQTSHLAAVRRLIKQVDVFVFTLGLTELWESSEDGAVYPLCPGTAAGVFDPQKYRFRNLRVQDVVSDMTAAFSLIRTVNPNCHFLLTVSPVPLTATASGQHVLSATVRSKSVLRAAADQLVEDNEFVDYFPSYEIISTSALRADLYEANKREVRSEGVDVVMKRFFAEFTHSARADALTQSQDAASDVECDEQILEFFRK